jgi:hypothetical protein
VPADSPTLREHTNSRSQPNMNDLPTRFTQLSRALPRNRL